MFCPSCESHRIAGPFHACDINDRSPRAFMACANCRTIFDAYQQRSRVVIVTTSAGAR